MMKGEIIVRFTMSNVCSKESLKSSDMTFEQMVRWLIREEGLFGVVDDRYKILNVTEIVKR